MVMMAVSVFLLGNGDGTFQNQTTYSTGSDPLFIIANDFNNDRKLDLAVANSNNGSISILLGNGDGTFQKQTIYSTDIGPTSVVAGDFNNDNILDIATANYDNSTIVCAAW